MIILREEKSGLHTRHVGSFVSQQNAPWEEKVDPRRVGNVNCGGQPESLKITEEMPLSSFVGLSASYIIMCVRRGGGDYGGDR